MSHRFVCVFSSEAAAARHRVWEQQQPHLLTCTVVAWLPVFTRPDAAQIVFDSWRFNPGQGVKALVVDD